MFTTLKRAVTHALMLGLAGCTVYEPASGYYGYAPPPAYYYGPPVYYAPPVYGGFFFGGGWHHHHHHHWR